MSVILKDIIKSVCNRNIDKVRVENLKSNLSKTNTSLLSKA